MVKDDGFVTSMSETMNLRILKKSRKKPHEGDIFTMQLPDLHYIFGRVIRTGLKLAPVENVNLIYVFKTRSKENVMPPRITFSCNNLLIPPMMVTSTPWNQGYFQTIGNSPLNEGEILRVHTFLNTINKKYYDEFDEEVTDPFEPIGIQGLTTIGGIDRIISKALGIEIKKNSADVRIDSSYDIKVATEIRIEPKNDDELERLLRLEDELMDAGVVWDAGYSTEVEGRIWQVDTGKGMSLDDVLRRLRKEDLHAHVE